MPLSSNLEYLSVSPLNISWGGSFFSSSFFFASASCWALRLRPAASESSAFLSPLSDRPTTRLSVRVPASVSGSTTKNPCLSSWNRSQVLAALIEGSPLAPENSTLESGFTWFKKSSLASSSSSEPPPDSARNKKLYNRTVQSTAPDAGTQWMVPFTLRPLGGALKVSGSWVAFTSVIFPELSLMISSHLITKLPRRRTSPPGLSR
mmetsp:Transcript_15114/g.33340  ORF Transcript_15114/g.33340 Transcript_15114/m.33340 type:complete len:206 (+) Transcript_15114:257-874(+)